MIKAVIFDMDGLMFDTERLSLDGWSHAGVQLGYDIKKDVVIKTCGLSNENTKRVFLKNFGNDFDYDASRKIRTDYMMKYIIDHGMPVKPGLMELLEFLRSNHYKMAIASSSEREKVEFYLKTANISGYFDKMVTGDMIKRGKPEPDIYLKAVEILGVAADECIALEDSPLGILSAYRAGIKPVLIPDLVEIDEQTEKIIYAKLTSLSDVIDLLNKTN